MKGPFDLNEIAININVHGPIGTYILSRGNNAAHYVGRSDSNLSLRLKQHAQEGRYVQFWFENTASSLEAYYLECEWYHKYKPLDSINHPAVPPGAAWKCPIAGCPSAI